MAFANSGRALAKALGVSEGAVRKAEKCKRIQKVEGKGFDIDACRKAWAGNSEPARSRVRTSVRTGAHDGPHSAPSEGSPVRTSDDAREAVTLILRVLAEEGIAIDSGEVDFSLARLAETILKARQRDLAIAEKRKQLLPRGPVVEHIAKSFAGFRQAMQRMPARYAAEMAAELGCDAGRLTAALDRMIAGTLTEMSAPVVR